MFICVQPYTVDTCSSFLKEMEQLESIWCWKVKDGSRLSFLALSVRAAQLFALYVPGLSGFFVGQWRPRCILSCTQRSRGSPSPTVTWKREHFFESMKCTNFWKSLQLSFWVLGLNITRRQSKSLDWISVMSLGGNCYCHSLLLLFCACLFII